MKLDAVRYINNEILRRASNLRYNVSEFAPSNFKDLYNSTGLVIWNGASDDTIFNDANVNYAFRALHDQLHLETGIGFSVNEEIELGRIQANQFTGLLADLVYSEVSGQAEYFKINGIFIKDQKQYAESYLINLGHKI